MGEISRKTILNWRFYIGFPILVASLLLAVIIEIVGMPCKFIYKATKRVSQSINYSKTLKKLTNWTFDK